MKKKIQFINCLFLLSLSSSYAQDRMSENLPGVDLIGKTYHVFEGKYADNESIGQSILDLSEAEMKTIDYQNVKYLVPKFINYSNIVSSESKVISGENINKISKELGLSAGINVDALVFSTSLNSSIFKKQSSEKYTYFSKYSYIIRNNRISLKNVNHPIRRIADIKPYLDKDFKEDINDSKIDPKQIFEIYGTHFLADVILGAKIESDVRVEKSSRQSIDQISIAVEAKYKGVGGNFKSDNNLGLDNSNNDFTSFLSAKGGEIALLGTEGNMNSNYAKWSDTVKNNPVLVDFDKNSLIPIWELADDEYRKNKLKDYFNNVLSEKYKKEIISNEPVIKVVKDFNRNDVKATIVDGYLKGVKKGWGGFLSTDYDDVEITISSVDPNKYNMNVYEDIVKLLSKLSGSRWYFYNDKAANSKKGDSDYFGSGNTTYSKYYDQVNDIVKIDTPEINANGEFPLYIILKNLNKSGATQQDPPKYGTWVKSDKNIKVSSVNNREKVTVPFFDGRLTIDLQF